MKSTTRIATRGCSLTNLFELATQYGTDKVYYAPVYELLLQDRRMRTHAVLEIGIGTPEAMKHVPRYQPGASLRMWREYFPNAHVFGMDIDHRVLFEERFIHTCRVDQGNANELGRHVVGLHFDLIVDDGSHKPEHQILGVKVLMPHLQKGGLYIIEDVNNFEEVLQGLEGFSPICIKYPFLGKTARCMVIRG